MCKQHLTLGCREAGLPIVSGTQFYQFTIVGHHTEQLLQPAQLELSLRHGGLLRAERTQGWMCLILGLSLSSAITDGSLKSFHFSDSPAQRSRPGSGKGVKDGGYTLQKVLPRIKRFRCHWSHSMRRGTTTSLIGEKQRLREA